MFDLNQALRQRDDCLLRARCQSIVASMAGKVSEESKVKDAFFGHGHAHRHYNK